MASCVAVAPDTVLHLDTLTPPGQCEYLLVTATDYAANLNVNELFARYFAFDAALSIEIIGACLLVFVSGHVLGKILAGLRRV